MMSSSENGSHHAKTAHVICEELPAEGEGLPPAPAGKKYVILADQDGQQVACLIDAHVDEDTFDWQDPEFLASLSQVTQQQWQPSTTPPPAPPPAVQSVPTKSRLQRAPVANKRSAAAPKTRGPRILSSRAASQSKSTKRPHEDDYALVANSDGKFELAKKADLKSSQSLTLSQALAQPASSGQADVGDLEPPTPEGSKRRRNRVEGHLACEECGATFVNNARLDRHLAVHQVFGSYLCPLCGKTYKYEYNLFSHWRSTCVEITDHSPDVDRVALSVPELRNLVEKIETEKSEMGPAEFHRRFRAPKELAEPRIRPLPELPLARRGRPCEVCHVTIMSSHLHQHLSVHAGLIPPNRKSINNILFCDLCGLMFRTQPNLIRHWRSGCPELPNRLDVVSGGHSVMTDEELVQAVTKELIVPDPLAVEEAIQRVNIEQSLEDSAVVGNVPKSSADEPEPDVVNDEDMELQEQSPGVDGPSSSSAHTPGTNQRHDHQFVKARKERIKTYTDEVASHKGKWSVNNGVICCPECNRSFANAGRLERHLLGFHSKDVRYHCMLCGNRFKYDYNLIYHYRHTCPYTKTYIEESVRKGLPADKFLPLVKDLAKKQNAGGVPDFIGVPMEHRMDSSCPLCGIVFSSADALDQHLAKRHADEITTSTGNVGQPHDQQEDDDADDQNDDAEINVMVSSPPPANGTSVVSIHGAPAVSTSARQLVDRSPVTPDTKPKRTAPPRAAKQQQQQQPSHFACAQCDAVFQVNAHLTRHIHRTHQAAQEDNSCRLCQLVFRTGPAVIAHWRSSKCSMMRQILDKLEQTSFDGLKDMSDQQLIDWVNSFKVYESGEQLPPVVT